MKPMLDSLCMDGDDAEDLGDMIEDAFGLSMPADAANWTTVGDIHAWLLAEFPASDHAGKCATSMAFHRLRAALRPLASEPIRPDTLLSAFGLSPRRLQHHLSTALDFSVQVQTLGWLAMAGIALILAAIGLAIVDPLFLLLLAPAIALIRHDPGLFDPRTVGEAARKAAESSFRVFAEAGADRRPPAIWAALQSVIAEGLGLERRLIAPATRLFPATP